MLEVTSFDKLFPAVGSVNRTINRNGDDEFCGNSASFPYYSLEFRTSINSRRDLMPDSQLFIEKFLVKLGLESCSSGELKTKEPLTPIYPPTTSHNLRALHARIVTAEIPLYDKQSLVLYLLCDLQEELSAFACETSRNQILPPSPSVFTSQTGIPLQYASCIQGLWNLDHFKIPDALKYITIPYTLPPLFFCEIFQFLLNFASHPAKFLGGFTHDSLTTDYPIIVQSPMLFVNATGITPPKFSLFNAYLRYLIGYSGITAAYTYYSSNYLGVLYDSSGGSYGNPENLLRSAFEAFVVACLDPFVPVLPAVNSTGRLNIDAMDTSEDNITENHTNESFEQVSANRALALLSLPFSPQESDWLRVILEVNMTKFPRTKATLQLWDMIRLSTDSTVNRMTRSVQTEPVASEP